MAYKDFKDLTQRWIIGKILRDKAFNIATNPKYDGYQRGLASVIYSIFDKKTSFSGIKNEDTSNKELAGGLHKPDIRKFKKRKAQSIFIDNIWSDDLADIQSISKLNKVFRFLFCVIYIFTKYAWVIPLKEVLPLQMLFKKFQKNLIAKQRKRG